MLQFLPYGLPCADVLAAELLRRPPQSPFPLGPRVRAEIIRELAVYTSCLSWVPRRGGSNYEFCLEAQGRLTRVLDRILEAAPLASRACGNPPDSSLFLSGDGDVEDGRVGVTAPDVQGNMSGCVGDHTASELVDPSSSSAIDLNRHLFDWDVNLYWDSQLDLFSQSLI